MQAAQWHVHSSKHLRYLQGFMPIFWAGKNSHPEIFFACIFGEVGDPQTVFLPFPRVHSLAGWAVLEAGGYITAWFATCYWKPTHSAAIHVLLHTQQTPYFWGFLTISHSCISASCTKLRILTLRNCSRRQKIYRYSPLLQSDQPGH